MPSPICTNALSITGPALDRKAFREAAASEDEILSFNRFIPMPEDIARSGDNSLIYQWCNENWGDRWTANETILATDTWRLEYRFITAYCPPDKVVQEMSRRFPTLSFSLAYYVADIEFLSTGHILCHQGDMTSKEYEEEGVAY